MKNYYFILGVSIYAREQEIKQAYRRLALKFHPDKNPSQEAETIFKEINEAYEVLGDPQKKVLYDQMLVGAEPVAQPVTARPHRDPRYRPKPPGTPRPPSRKRELFLMMQRYLNVALMSSRIALLVASLLLADFSLPQQREETTITGLSRKRDKKDPLTVQIQLEDGRQLNVPQLQAYDFRKGSRVVVYRSAFLSVPRKLTDESSRVQASMPISIYGNFIFFPLILLITSLLGTFYWKGVEFRFNLGIVNVIMLFFNLIFLQVHKIPL